MPELRPDLRAERVPAAIRAAFDALRAAGHETWLVGGCVRDLLRGMPVVDFDAATSALPEAVLALFRHAVPIGVQHGTVMIPTHDGPFDVTTFRGGQTLRDDLAHRDFTIDAIAWNPATGAVVDPHGGVADLERGLLRACGSAADRFGEDPLRALRAARLVAALDLAADAAIEPAMAAARGALGGVARERIRHELAALAVARCASRGIAMLRRTRIESDLLPGAAADTAAWIDALPPDPILRLAAWLRGTNAEHLLTRLRFPKRTALAVARLLALHPIDGRGLRGDADLRRLLRRAGDDGVERLLRLREAERGAPLDGLRTAFERVRATDAKAGARVELALDGAAVMRLLGVPPGPQVGAALRHLGEAILADPSCNTPDALAGILHAWAARGETRDAAAREEDADGSAARR
jgi:tRNA nucleotidyltransferase (CCA-adding enzyme)